MVNGNGTAKEGRRPSRKENAMNKLWNALGNFANLITVIAFIAGGIIGVLAYLGKFDDKLQFVIILFLLILILVVCGWTAYRLNEIRSPKKPRIIKAFDQPDTYILYQGVWRKIPDWQTRDYLGHILGFRPGEEDIEEVSKEFIRQMKVGAPMESISTYSR